MPDAGFSLPNDFVAVPVFDFVFHFGVDLVAGFPIDFLVHAVSGYCLVVCASEMRQCLTDTRV